MITLTLYNREATDYGVCWMTDEAGEPVLEYTDVTDTDFAHVTRIYASAENYNGMTRNTAVIENAAPGRQYLWRVGDRSGIFSPAEVFTALDPNAEKLDFLVFTDSQDEVNDGLWWQPAWQDALAKYPDAALSLHAGDMVQNGSNPEMWRLVTDFNEHYFRSLPMLPITGNHDYWCELKGIIYNHFNINTPRENSKNGVYYSVDAGPVHFTMLSSGDVVQTDRHGLLPEQLEWARRDIASSDKRWKIVMIHTPLYSPGKYGSRPELMTNPTCLREQLNVMFAELGVDLVISGHDHIFSESYPIGPDGAPERDCEYIIKKLRGEFVRLAVDPKGPIHLIPGCCGNQNRYVEDEMDAVAASYFRDIIDMPEECVSYAAVCVDHETLTVDFSINRVLDGGEVIRRRFGIKKS